MTCGFSECEGRVVGRGLCSGHYQQYMRRGYLTYMRKRHPVSVRDESGRKRCTKCTSWKPEFEFSPDKRATDKLRVYCKECHAHLEGTRRFGSIWSRKGDILGSQGGICPGCKTDEPIDEQGWVLDHDHSCCPDQKSCGKCVRGILCSRCNRALGLAGESIETLRNLANYLERDERVV